MKKGLLFLSLALVFVLAGCGSSGDQTKKKDGLKETLSPQKAKAEAQQFVNNNLMGKNQQAEITNISEDRGLYKLSVNAGGRTIESYMTKDGDKFFPQAMNTKKQKKQTQNQNSNNNQQQKTATVDKKTETPQVELFVMSHCPYGTQMEKAILPVAKTLGDKINFDLKFCDYAMHGKKELDEEMNQHCIKQEQPEKLIGYLDCFLANQNSQKCMQKVGVDQSAVESCVSQVDQKYQITKKFNDKSTWKNGRFPVFPVYAEANNKYGISGSPALVVNGQEVQASRNPNALLKTICSAFKEKPEECGQELSTSSPSPGFGSGSNGGSSGGSCS